MKKKKHKNRKQTIKACMYRKSQQTNTPENTIGCQKNNGHKEKPKSGRKIARASARTIRIKEMEIPEKETKLGKTQSTK